MNPSKLFLYSHFFPFAFREVIIRRYKARRRRMKRSTKIEKNIYNKKIKYLLIFKDVINYIIYNIFKSKYK